MPETTYAQLLKLGRAVRKERFKLRLSQEDFAESAGVHRTYIGQVERGEVNISFENLVRITRAMRLPPSKLFARAGL